MISAFDDLMVLIFKFQKDFYSMCSYVFIEVKWLCTFLFLLSTYLINTCSYLEQLEINLT